jgi:Lon protease-like protein
MASLRSSRKRDVTDRGIHFIRPGAGTLEFLSRCTTMPHKEMDATLPDEIAVMTLPGAVFFPQALLPLHIFEPRYRTMLGEVLAGERKFAVAALDPDAAKSQFEPPHRVATVGLVRACHHHPDGSANLLLQGVARVAVLGIAREEPYRLIRVRPLASRPGADAAEDARDRAGLLRLLDDRHELGGAGPGGFLKFLSTVHDPGALADLAAFTLCDDAALKQRLLETLDVPARLRLLTAHVARETEALRLARRLQGGLSDDDIARN